MPNNEMNKGSVVCGHCSTVAVAEIEGDYLCSGCLMSVLMCTDEPMPIRRLNSPEFSEMVFNIDTKTVLSPAFTRF